MSPTFNLPALSCAVRPAQTRDVAEMAQLAEQLGYECTPEEVRARLLQMQDAEDYAIYVAELENGEIGGWVNVYVFRSIQTGTYAEINGLVVEQGVRSRGIGRSLLEAAEEWARRIGCDEITVRSNVKRRRAHRFYINNRYEHVKTQKVFKKGTLTDVSFRSLRSSMT